MVGSWSGLSIVVVPVEYMNPAGCEGGHPTSISPSSCPSSTCSDQSGDAQRHCPRPLKVTGTTLTTRHRRTVHAQDLVAAPITPRRILAAGRKATHRMALHLQTLVPSDTPRVQRTTRYEATTSPRTTARPNTFFIFVMRAQRTVLVSGGAPQLLPPGPARSRHRVLFLFRRGLRQTQRCAAVHLHRLGVRLPRPEPRPDRAQTGGARARQSSVRAIPGGTPATGPARVRDPSRSAPGSGPGIRRWRRIRSTPARSISRRFSIPPPPAVRTRSASS